MNADISSVDAYDAYDLSSVADAALDAAKVIPIVSVKSFIFSLPLLDWYRPCQKRRLF